MSLLNTETASRLCKACGLCCNGVMFHTVRLQAADNPQDLVALGLRIKRKKSGSYILQPCPAFKESQCTIYASRPERCRLFECQQLKRVSAGEISESDALEKIQSVKKRVKNLTDLLDRAGKSDEKRPLSKRFEKILAEPAFDLEITALHEQLTRESNELDAILDQDFRIATTTLESPAN